MPDGAPSSTHDAASAQEPVRAAPERITVFGGSGFVGRHIVQRLAAGGAEVRVAVRRPERVSLAGERTIEGRVEAIRADVWDEATVGPAVADADAVVNTVGHYVERGGASFEAIHGQGAGNVARAAAAAGVRRLAHISGLGADPASSSPYVRARASGERLVLEAFPDAVVLRPSVVFGPGDAFFSRLAALARRLPVLPLFGAGDTRLQPVFVGDVAEAVAQTLAGPWAGQVVELGGPRVYTYKELLQLVLTVTGRKRLLMPVPFPVWSALAAALAPLPGAPISRDQVKLMQQDNVVEAEGLTLHHLGITPTAAEDVLPSSVGR